MTIKTNLKSLFLLLLATILFGEEIRFNQPTLSGRRISLSLSRIDEPNFHGQQVPLMASRPDFPGGTNPSFTGNRNDFDVPLLANLHNPSRVSPTLAPVQPNRVVQSPHTTAFPQPPTQPYARQPIPQFAPSFNEGYGGQMAPLPSCDSCELPTVRFTVDGFLYDRFGGADTPLILEAPFPSSPSLTSGDFDFEGRWAGQADLTFFAKPGSVAPRAGILWTGAERLDERRTGNPADIFFFQGTAANPASQYKARYRTTFALGDAGLRRTLTPTWGISGSLVFGQIEEELDIVDPNDSAISGSTSFQSGFFSQVKNSLYGGQLAVDGQLWTNGYLKIEGNLAGGLFYNDIRVAGQTLNISRKFRDTETTFMGRGALSLVIPADPVNFRIGYQAIVFDGIALAAAQSQERRLVVDNGANPTETVGYHGLTFGFEWLH